MINRSYIKLSGILLLIVGTLVVSLAFFLPYLLDVNSYRDEILASLQKSLNRKVTFSRGAFTWHFGPSFDFDGITVKEPDNSADFLTAGRITVRLSLLPLLEKRVVVHDISLEGANIRLVRGVDGKLNIDDLLAPGKENAQVRFHKVLFRHSTLQWHDMAIRPQGLSAVAANIDLTLDNLIRGRKGSIKLACDMPAASGPPAHIALGGTVRLAETGQSLLTTELNGSAEIKQAEIGRFWPYLGSVVPFPNPGGRLDAATGFKGTLREFAAKGRIRINNAAVTWPAVFHATVAPRFLQAEYDVKLSAPLLDVRTIDLSTDGFRIKGSVQVHDYDGKDPRIVARAHTPGTFRYEDVRGYVPYGIIPHDTSDYIENKIKSGIFKLDTGVLDGRVSQIAHMERGDNCTILQIRGPVEKAVLSYGPKAPAFNNIKGIIELKGKDFNLAGMTGFFGSSPFKLQGSITEYVTADKQSTYPVRMEITPHAPEVAWLARIAGAGKLDFSGASDLVLTGNGHFSAYRLDGEWNLKQAAYAYPGAIRKPAGMANHLAFSSTISGEEIRLTSLAYSLPPLALSATALLKYTGQPHLGFDLQTNQFLLNDALPIVPMWQQYRPHGRVQAHIRGSGNPEDFSAMDYSGSINLNAFSFQPAPRLKPVTGIGSTITFQGNSLETGSMSARYGDSPVSLRGRVKSLKNGEAEIALTSPQLFLRDLNLAPAKAPGASIRRLHALLAIGNGRYAVTKLSGLYNTSNFSVSGDYTPGTAPTANLAFYSSNLDLDDLLQLAMPSEQGGREPQAQAQAPSRMNLNVKLNVESGTFRKISYSKLNAALHQENGVLSVQGLETRLYDGRMTAKGRIAPANGQERRYDLNFALERVNAENLLQALDAGKAVTGTLNLSGDLTARGATLAELKRTGSGSVRLKLEKGALRKFSMLSKIFSILNVSQLFRFQLPDMVSNGMPYNDIRGTFTLGDGSLATQDLFINSNAMNITIIGKADIVKEDLNFTIGVQPLQTVDKIVNHIPVVGWLLTGKGKSVVTAYFEAKGKWSDPQVSAIPVKSMAKGVLDVFKRAFQLPVKLFTDTGEVILGQ